MEKCWQQSDFLKKLGKNGNETYMKCHYTGQILFYLSILLLVNGCLFLIMGQRMSAGVMSIVIGLLSILVTGSGILGVGVCATGNMACGMTAGWARVCGGAAIITGIITLILVYRAERKEQI